MLCIASFFIFVILGIFSAYYRKLAGKAWYCVVRRITFRPCDINFSQEIKGKLLGKIILKKPRFAKFLEKWIDFFAFGFIVLSIWSLFMVFFAGLNLFVYDTCDPHSVESCSLGGESCGINTTTPGFFESMGSGDIFGYFGRNISEFGNTLSRIPDRFREWKVSDYVTSENTYYLPYDSKKETILEILDPSCVYCAKLFGNVKKAGADQKYNLTYFVFPIPNSNNANGYKFPHSYLLAKYLLAIKIAEKGKTQNGISKDWQFLEEIFTGHEGDMTMQEAFNLQFNDENAVLKINDILRKIGYDEGDIKYISSTADGPEVKKQLAEQKNIVETKIRTIKIPTILLHGRRYDRVINPDQF